MKPLKTLLNAAIFAFSITLISPNTMATEKLPKAFKSGATILFQGDSITDGGRGKKADQSQMLGQSYPMLIAAECSAHFPEQKLHFLNRGVSGNVLPDLAKRWQTDTLDLKPDVLSILIGVNDVWHNFNDKKEVPYEACEKIYDQLISDTTNALPNIKIVLCDPFILPGTANKTNWNEWQPAVERMRGIVERLSKKYNLPVVHFQKMFDAAVKQAPAEYWIHDGVHPTFAGHQLMTDEWLKVVSNAWKK
jgi:lysophospholipase L1-like esterase